MKNSRHPPLKHFKSFFWRKKNSFQNKNGIFIDLPSIVNPLDIIFSIFNKPIKKDKNYNEKLNRSLLYYYIRHLNRLSVKVFVVEWNDPKHIERLTMILREEKLPFFSQSLSPKNLFLNSSFTRKKERKKERFNPRLVSPTCWTLKRWKVEKNRQKMSLSNTCFTFKCFKVENSKNFLD